MKTKQKIQFLLVSLLLLTFAFTAAAVTPAEADTILFIKQEEKVARDAYLVLGEMWGATIFANIAVSEQNHMDAVDGLILKYHLEDTTPAAVGEFTIHELQDLYDELIELGSKDLESALWVGVIIEETDIKDLQAAIAAAKERPVRRVYSNLLAGSYNHLEAFLSALEE